MDGKIDEIREALEIADAFCGRHTADECPDTIAIPIKDALATLSAIDQDAIRLAQRMKSLLQSISPWFACWGIATKDDLGQSVEEFDREITDILSAEPAQDKRPMNEDEVCLNVGCEYHDKKYEQNCSGATNGSASPAAELCTMWRPKPAQDDGKPEGTIEKVKGNSARYLCIIRNIRNKQSKAWNKRTMNWVLLRDYFGLGSTMANRWCEWLEIDPDEYQAEAKRRLEEAKE